MKFKLIRGLGNIMLLALAVAALWLWGGHQVEKRAYAECEAQYHKQIVELERAHKKELKDVETKKAAIHSKPNASRNSLLNAMHNGQL